MKMKKLLLLLIVLTTFTNVIYASFPVDTNKTDTTQVIVKESTEQYHLRMKKQGFDISSCMCVDCREFKGVGGLSSENNVILSPEASAKVSMMFLGSAMLIGLVTIGIYVDFDNIPPIMLPVVLTIFLLFYLRIILNRMKQEAELNL